MNPDSQTSVEHAQSYRAAFSQMQPTATAALWLQALRKRALEKFIDRGFPTTAEENWRYTDLTRVAQRSFDYLDGAPQENEPAIALEHGSCSDLGILKEDEIARLTDHPLGLVVFETLDDELVAAFGAVAELRGLFES